MPSNVKVTIENMDAKHMPFEDNTFDAVRIDYTLQHIPEPERAFAEVVRVLKPGGRLVCTEPDIQGWVLYATHPILVSV